MSRDEEVQQLRAENAAFAEALRDKEAELEQAKQTNEDLRACLKEALGAIGLHRDQAKTLQGQVECLQRQVKSLQSRVSKDSHNSHLPPSSDRFVRVLKSLRQKSGKKPGGQKGHPGHHLRQVQTPDQILTHQVQSCVHCQRDLHETEARIPKRRQVMDLPSKRLWVTEHRIEEKQCPACSHINRATFPSQVWAPAQYAWALRHWQPI
ncbi:MAG TPA: DUF6444 domain-containing protein [Ktedonosporobacter sp.]|nr:DUF6444 domain-containing protein [Ktedonosporobacter sp.]